MGDRPKLPGFHNEGGADSLGKNSGKQRNDQDTSKRPVLLQLNEQKLLPVGDVTGPNVQDVAQLHLQLSPKHPGEDSQHQ